MANKCSQCKGEAVRRKVPRPATVAQADDAAASAAVGRAGAGVVRAAGVGVQAGDGWVIGKCSYHAMVAGGKVTVSIKFLECKECKQLLPEKFFPIRTVGNSGLYTNQKIYRDKRCMGCRDKATDEKNARNRFVKKAYNTLYGHAQKAIDAGFAKSLDEFRALYGWDVQQIAHDMAHAYKNGCPICHKSYKSMAHGYKDLTLDIIDPRKLPYYGVNTQLICSTDNTRKQRTDPADYGEVMLGWRIWEEHQNELEEDEWAGTLFEGLVTVQSQPRLLE
jgi:hypothetical protein